jgi:cell wall-associated NlpC family hydrolase
MEYAVQRALVAPTSTMPSGHPRRLANVVVALSMALTAIAGVSVAPALGFQTSGTDSSFVAPPAAVTHPTSTGTSSASHRAPVRDAVRTPASSSRDRTHQQPTARPDTKPHVTTHVASTASQSQGRRIVRLAASHIGAHFQIGATGMRYFDCSGLIYRVYAQAGLLAKIGGNHTAAGYYYWFKQRGLANRHSPKAGDLVIWTEKGQIAHSGIYVGGGRVISALINPWGVKKTHINTIHARFLAYLHVRW